MPAASRGILTLNSGSSSLKAALYSQHGRHLALERSFLAERIGLPRARFSVIADGGKLIQDQSRDLPSFGSALQEVLQAMAGQQPDAIGHRVVHGGSHYAAPARVDGALLSTLESLVPIDRMHLPQAIESMQRISRALPDVPQVACFDTAFHRTMPRVAQDYALPPELTAAGIMRYGFHGLSYEYVVARLRELGDRNDGGRMIVAHLGNGASMAAIRDGRSVETTMGFTPSGGLVMGTRAGDLDPGVLVYLVQRHGMTAEQLGDVVNRQSGLLAISGSTSDMRELLEARGRDPRAAQAVELFCYRARQFVGSLMAVLGGLDTLVFTGGIGEHAAAVRREICGGLEFAGILLDDNQNDSNAAIISRPDSPVTVRIVPTDEDVMIARHTARLLWG